MLGPQALEGGRTGRRGFAQPESRPMHCTALAAIETVGSSLLAGLGNVFVTRPRKAEA